MKARNVKHGELEHPGDFCFTYFGEPLEIAGMIVRFAFVVLILALAFGHLCR